MRNNCFGLLAAVTLLAGAARAAEPLATAQDRATLYQREVQTALTRHHWRITQDEAGKLIAERRRTDQDGAEFVLGDDNTYARLEIDFRADGRTHTASSARASLCIYDTLRSSRVGIMAYPPLALRDPRLTQEYRVILAEAESHLAASHHAYAAAGASSFQAAGSSDKLAMK